jgi:DNA-binding NtrC family response regulator
VSDIPPLLDAFLAKYNARLGKAVRSVADDAVAALVRYRWPGNIRELENVVERTLLFAESDRIELADLPAGVRSPHAASGRSGATRLPLDTGTASLKEVVRQATAEIEKELIAKALETTAGNVTRAARLLGISRKGLQNKMRGFGLRESEGTKT